MNKHTFQIPKNPGIDSAPSKCIPVLTLSFGSGHVRAAQAVARALLDGGSDAHVPVIDVIERAAPWFEWFYVKPYWWMLRNAKGLWRGIFERRQRKHHHSTAPRWMFRHGCANVLGRLKSMSPQLVIVTEIGAVELASLGRREGWFNAPILAIQTDFQAEPPWVQPEVDFYCVATEAAKSQLVRWGISPHRILVNGVPIDPGFALAVDRRAILESLGLDARNPVVLVMGGGMGPVPVDTIVKRLETCGLPIQVLAVAGHNQEVLARLEALQSKVALELRTLGWTDNIAELMHAADLLITKPGGVTTAEALAVGIPMILTHPIPGPEERNASYLTAHGVAVSARNDEDIPRVTCELLKNAAKRAEMSRLALDLARPDAAHASAQVARALLQKTTYIDLLASPPWRPGDLTYVM